MNIETGSIVIGSQRCNAQCPFCIASLTPSCGTNVYEEPDLTKFPHFVSLAARCSVTTILLTGKGEPTLFPDDILSYLDFLHKRSTKDIPIFPFVELQTNGILFDSDNMKNTEWTEERLHLLHKLGLTTICISVVHWEKEKNQSIYQPHGKYMDLEKVIALLHKCGFMVRLSCMALKNYIDTPEKLSLMLDFVKANGVKQFTIRNISRPESRCQNDVDRFVRSHALSKQESFALEKYCEDHGDCIMELSFGAKVYDINGQNCGWFNCLTTSLKTNSMRQIIFFPDGSIHWDWKYAGSVLL